MESKNLHLMFDDRKITILCFVSKDLYDEALGITLTVMNDLPHSLHSPSKYSDVGIQIAFLTALQKPRWKFKLANWQAFSKQVKGNL